MFYNDKNTCNRTFHFRFHSSRNREEKGREREEGARMGTLAPFTCLVQIINVRWCAERKGESREERKREKIDTKKEKREIETIKEREGNRDNQRKRGK